MTIATSLTPTPTTVRPRWSVRPPAPPEAVARLCQQLGIPPLLASVVWSRGLRNAASEMLEPPLTLSAIPALHEAAARIDAALRARKRILIHGDYDADGMSGTAVLTLGLRALGGNVTPFIPNRLSDGYGISPERLEEHIARAELFITVDCGISSHAEVQRLCAAGVEVIVSDHHHPGQTLPNCLVIHPSLSPLAKAGLPELTGAGVAYHLLWALHQRLGLEDPTDYADLASIGTIADVAPLLGENRALVKEGLARLSDSRWPGLRASVERTLGGKAPTARDVAFVLAPRLNAAGRLGEADLGLELLTTNSAQRARELAIYLDARNNDRRKLQDGMFEDALTRVDREAPAIVLDDPHWHAGVMGIVASKLLDRHYKPVFIIAGGKGSVRSVAGISAVGGLAHARAHLKRYGGHSQAAGFAIDDGCIGAFRDSIYAYTEQFPPPAPQVTADAFISADDVTDELYEAILTLEPYGQGHPAPVFALTDTLRHAKAVGQSGKHLQLRIATLKGVAWNQGHDASSFSPGGRVNAAVSLQENHFRGQRSLEFVASALQQAEPLEVAFLAISENQPCLRYQRISLEQTRSQLGNTQHYDPQDTTGETSWQVGSPPPERLVLHALPFDQHHPLALLFPLEPLVVSSCQLLFALAGEVLADLETLATRYPTRHDLRRAFVALQRGQPVPFETVKVDLCRSVLTELELLDPRGRPLKGQKRDPYSAPTFLGGMIERYRLTTFLNAYRYADDPSFTSTVAGLFGTPAH